MTARQRAARRAIRRRRVRRILIGSGIVAAAVALAVALPLAAARAPVCVDDPDTFPASGIEGWQGEQLENAAAIIRTAEHLGFDRNGQVVGVMTAMGESSLRAIDHGDWETSGVTNPDGTRTTSIGLFQQQEWWGSTEQRMDPESSATLFYQRLAKLAGWEQMEPSHAINRVQVNTDPEHYAAFEDDAEAVVDELTAGCEIVG